MNKLWNATFADAIHVLNIIESHHHQAYFVGGCVRDFLLQRPIKDIDIASSALPEEIINMFDTVIPVGLEHGTVIVRFQDVSYEVTTFRHDSRVEANQRHENSGVQTRRIEDDVQYRDFTMNAMAMNRFGEIIDLFDAKEDLDNKVIRSVGQARERFLEDPLRMLRGIRFTSQLGFQIEKQTYEEIIHLKAEMETVAIERVVDELSKLFQGVFIEQGMNDIKATEIYRHIPLWKSHPSVLQRLPSPLTAFHSIAEVIALFSYIDDTITMDKWVREWKCSNKTKRTALQLLHALHAYEESGLTKWIVYQLETDNQAPFTHLVYLLHRRSLHSDVTTLYKQLPITNRAQLNINGYELQQLFPQLRQGRWIKECIEKVEYEVVMHQLSNTKKDIKEWILCHPPEIN